MEIGIFATSPLEVQQSAKSGSARHISQSINGIELVSIDEGQGEHNALLLLHGWTCNKTMLDAQRRHYSKHRRVLVPDLRGHGDSDAPVQQYNVGTFVEDLIWQLDDLGIQRVVVVGHSMGGTIGLELAVRYPDRVSGLVMIDTLVFPSSEMITALSQLRALIEVSGLEAGLDQATSLLFCETDDKELRKEILAKMMSTPVHVAEAALRGVMLDHDATIALRGCKAPIAYIGAATLLAETAAMLKLRPEMILAQTLGSGHFSPVIVPDQINAMIDRFLAIVD